MLSGQQTAAISLPTGGGALHGIGEKFAPDLHTGTGNFSVPIALPPGRNGFGPQLRLVYSSGNGNGPFGLGWALDVPGVARQTAKGIPRYDDAHDTFILSGAEDLVPVGVPLPTPASAPSAPAVATRYRPRTEGLFAHIDHLRDASPSGHDSWQVSSKDGLVSWYGSIPDATDAPDAPDAPVAAGTGSDPAVIADPADRTKIFAWKLVETRDPFGNRIVYTYDRDLGTDGLHRWDQLYLRQIRYADYADVQGATAYLVSVTFVYADEERPDPFSAYRSGFEIRTRQRCVRIEVRTHADQERLARTYHLIYLDERPELAALRPLNGVSLLSQVQVVGHDGAATELLPPLEFGYSHFDPNRRDFFPLSGPDLPPNSLAHPDYALVDLFGSGLPDVLEMNGTVRYWRNVGEGRFDLPREMHAAPAGLRLADQGVQIVDANGDGRADLLVTLDGLAGYYPLRFGGAWDHRSFQRYRVAPTFDLEDPEVRLVDLDGDGVTDAVRSGVRFDCYFNDPHAGWTGTRRVERRALERFPDVTFSDPRVKWADMTGDGLQDIVLVHDGVVEYWPNLGNGDWAPRVTMRHNPRLPFGYNPRRILLGDVDGDGAADLVYVGDTIVTLWINQSGKGWSAPLQIAGTPPVTDMTDVRLADVLGSGVGGVLWTAEADGLSRTRMYFLDFTGGTKPYLLNEMDNHLGAVTRVAYAPSTRFYLEDQRQPATRWKTPLPFPVQVVARVEVLDHHSGGKLTTEFGYHHGYWDGAEREFRGFARVDQRDTEVFETYHAAGLHPEDQPFTAVPPHAFSPPTETRTWFHPGPIGDEFGDWEEADFGAEFWPGDPPALARPLAMSQFLKGLPRRARRDALRAQRGSVLRTELYALDGTERQGRPYTVTESLYGVREEAPPGPGAGPGEGDRPRIFFPHKLGDRTTQWERGDDPMARYTFTNDYDAYGQPRAQLSVAVPRGRDVQTTAAAGEPYLVTYTQTTYAQRDDAERYLVDRVARTTTSEILNDGSPTLASLRVAIQAGTLARRVIGQTLNSYDGPAFQGLPFGQLGDFGALVRTESLVFTQEILHDAYRSGDAVLVPPEEPPYLVPGTTGTTTWTSEYPQEFRERLAPLAGYGYSSGDAASPYVAGYFATTERRSYDFHELGGTARGLVRVRRDPLGHDTHVAFDAFDLLPTVVTDPADLVTQAAYEYRVLQPHEVTDPNGNRTVFAFTPLGLLGSTAVIGKANESIGDTLEMPSTRLLYDFMAFVDRQQPIAVSTIRRVHHVNDTDIPLPDRDETIRSTEYSDGFGRLLQTRAQAEDVLFGDPLFGGAVLPADQALPVGDAIGQPLPPAPTDPQPRVVVSGWQTYDNKGRVVEKYEPFFSGGWDYAAPIESQLGQKVTMYYDPRGQVIRTVNPDGSEQRVLYGIPADLADPDHLAPTPWDAYTYDANDNAGRTHPDTSLGYQQHWNTPSSLEVDALGRTVKAIARNGPHPATDWYSTRSTYDIQGNLLTVTDALQRVAFRHVYDLAKHPLRSENVDAGVRRSVLDAGGNPIEQRDSKGALTLHAYDALNRPARLWARDDSDQALTLRERLLYGDSEDSGVSLAQTASGNLLGKPYRHYDEAGLLTFAAYDFKGNTLEKVRQVVSDAAILAVFDPPPPNWQVPAFRVDWQPPPGMTPDTLASGLLEPTSYPISTTYDALNRVTAVRYPVDADGERKELRPHYNRAGALDRVELDGTTYVERIAYNAKGQRSLIAYGNGVMTRHAYDPQTVRLVRLRSERYTTPGALTYHPAGAPLQDLAYSYDLAGNILGIQERVGGCGVHNNPGAGQVADAALAQLLATGDALIRRFTYDPLYRLLSATGRECGDIPAPRPWADDQRCGFDSGSFGTPSQDNAPQLTALYEEDYTYDPAWNMASLKHSGNGITWTRHFGMGGRSPQQWSQEWPNHLDPASIWPSPPGNRLTHVGDDAPGTSQTHVYDANGNLVREHTVRRFEWDHADQMRVFCTQSGDAEPSIHAHYLYDTSGQRVKKLVRKQGGQVEVTLYLDGLLEHHRLVQGATSQENDTLHVMDNQRRIALVRIGAPFPDDTTPAIKFHLGDHLDSSTLVLDATGAWVNREEYLPYGETSLGSFARKRFRFTAKERDEESGLYYHGARYYAPWIARWASSDPAGLGGGMNLYAYGRNCPIGWTDSTGTQPNAAPGREDADTIGNGTLLPPTPWYELHPGGVMYEQIPAQGPVTITTSLASALRDIPERPRSAGKSRTEPPEETEAPSAWMDALKAVGGLVGYLPSLVGRAAEDLATDLGMSELDIQSLNFVFMMTGPGEIEALGYGAKALETEMSTTLTALKSDTRGGIQIPGTVPQAYSVAFEARLTELGPGIQRVGIQEAYQVHFAEANEQLLKAMADPELAEALKQTLGAEFEGMILSESGSGRVLSTSPTGWTWHHVLDEPGVLHLMPRSQHIKGSAWQWLLHPGPVGKGGMAQWGLRF